MNAIQDQAICIRRQDYSESSQIVSLFSRDNGKVRGIGKGSRRAKGKFSGGIDLLTLGNLMFAPARGDSGLATLMEFELAEAFPQIRADPYPAKQRKISQGDLIAQFTEELDPASRIGSSPFSSF